MKTKYTMAILEDLHIRSLTVRKAMRLAEGIAFDLRASSTAFEALRAKLQATTLFGRCVDDPKEATHWVRALEERAHIATAEAGSIPEELAMLGDLLSKAADEKVEEEKEQTDG